VLINHKRLYYPCEIKVLSADSKKQARAYKEKYPIALSFPGIIAVKEDANKRALKDILSFHVFPGTKLVSGMYPYHLSHVYMIALQIKIKFTINRIV
jgi:hypothetical protein